MIFLLNSVGKKKAVIGVFLLRLNILKSWYKHKKNLNYGQPRKRKVQPEN